MSFAGRRLMLARLVDIVLPGGTIRLGEGGIVKLSGETYRAKDPAWGTIGAVEAPDEAVGDEAPGLVMTFLPVSAAAAAALADDENYLAPVRVRLARVDRDTMIADPASVEQLGDWLMDEPEMVWSDGKLSLRIGLITWADRLMNVNKGNVLASGFHESVWPGEYGLRNAVNAGRTVAWRTNAPPRGAVRGGGGGGGFGGNGGFYLDERF